MKTVFAGSGVANEKMEVFDQCYDTTAGSDTQLYVSNVVNSRSFDVKTPEVVVKVDPERTDLISTRVIDGRECLVIELGANVEVNGITVRGSLDVTHPNTD